MESPAGEALDWDEWIVRARAVALGPRTGPRVELIQDELVSRIGRSLELAQVQEVVKLLLSTVPRYTDHRSRSAVLGALSALLSPSTSPESAEKPQTASPVLPALIKWVDSESTKLSKAGTSGTRFVVLTWAGTLFQHAKSAEGPQWEALVSALSRLLDGAVDEERTKKASVRKAALGAVRRAIRNSSEQIPRLIKFLTSAKSDPSYAHAPLLGLVLDVALHLKAAQKEAGLAYIKEAQSVVDGYYLSNVLGSKTVPPPRALNALNDYFAHTASESLSSTFVPAFEKAIPKAPEVALAVIGAFFSALPQDGSTKEARTKLVPALLVPAKSTNASLRAAAVNLFTTLFSTDNEAEDAAEAVVSLIAGGKTSSADHRTALYTMLAALPPSASCSKAVPGALLTQLPKEPNDVAVGALMRALAVHLPSALSAGAALSAAQVAALVKSSQETKVSIRRAACSTVGSVLWALPATDPTEEAKTFAVGVLPALEGALKSVSANALTAPAGPMEGYVAIAVLKGRLARWGVKKIDDAILANATMQGLYVPGAKPSFFLWEKVYRKLASAGEESWLLHALEAAFELDADKIAKDSHTRASFAAAVVHLVTDGAHESRREVLAFVERVNATNPKLIHETLREGVRTWLVAQEKALANAKPLKEDEEPPKDRAPRFRALLISLSIFGQEVDAKTKTELMTELVVIAHHPALGTEAGIWINLLQRAQLVPEPLIEANLEKVFSLLFADASTTPTSTSFSRAAYTAATTLSFVLPAAIVPSLYTQFESDLDVSKLAFMGSLEYGVWATPEGVPFVDVLSAAKPKAAPSSKNSKEREIEIWEAELREALARKKPVAATLSKGDRVLLEKQLAKEADVRQAVAEALGRLKRGFELLLCLINSRAELVREFLARMVDRVLEVIVLRPATLVAPEAFGTYQALGDICSDRLGVSKLALGVAVLRGLEAPVVPDNFTSEPLPALVTRVLHRLRYVAEQSPFEAGTFAYAAPLISKVLRAGGIGLEKSEAEAILEQVTLGLDFIAFHARSCGDIAFPRLEIINDLLATLSAYPVLSRSATQALSDVCEAIASSASQGEIDAVLEGAMTDEVYVRFACLQALLPLDLTEMDWSAALWVAAHDVDLRNRELALQAWGENALDVPSTFAADLIPLLAHGSQAIREATAEAIAEGIEFHRTLVAQTIEKIVLEYHDKAKEILPSYDQYGMLIEASLNAEDPWKNRVALATTLRLMAPNFGPEDVKVFFDLLIAGEALGDRSQQVRSEMLEAAQEVIDLHGKENLQELIKTFEEYLGRSSTSEAQDHIIEALVILFGRLARHLDPNDARVKSVITRLVDALNTPSEVVQAAVCDCLPPLIRVIKDDVPDLVDQLLRDLFTAEKYASRRGAAYGLAGVVKGRGLSSLKEFGVMGRLKDNAEDKKAPLARQGALFGFEILATVLGRIFEPYISEIVPVLLQCFGDASTDVREATQDAARAIMGKLSAHAVKLILPTLLMGLDDKQWRGKKGAIELMGAMAFLAPRQLSTSLPTILPRLTEVLTDTHKQVRESANTSLKRFGEVVSNPEIQEMVPVLLGALVDPSGKTPKALDALLATTFAHFIDSSSLALLVPILDRGLRERSADVKRKAAAIVGNMATLTDGKDLVPYLNQLVPLLRSVLVDPVPEARSTAAKSLGGLVERLGEHNFADLIDQLMVVLKSPSSGVDQQGAAQGLAEVLAGLGTDRLEGLLPTILTNTSSPRTYVREGHISLLIFLPVTFGDRFAPYLGKIIAPVLGGLADDSDYVREASMRAGRMIVANHSTKAIDLLLPELELGLFDQAWRIRQSSVQLIGDLLFRLTGITGKPESYADGDEDADELAGASGVDTKKAMLDTLGKEKRDKVLAALYISRQDNVGAVRQAAIGVWKALVPNTPRTVREVLPVLMQIIVRILASPGLEQRETAARCLADTCRKLGEAVLGEVIAILRKAMESPERRQREGVCLALTELMANTPSSSLEAHESSVIQVVRSALVDSDPSVRTAAAQAFDVAQQVIGTRSIDETIPTLLDALQTPGETADAALAALTEVMQVRADKIFPILIPNLIAAPISAFNARALASLVRVAGSALGKRLTNIVDALQAAVGAEKDEETRAELDEALSAVLGSVTDHESGLDSLMMHMLSLSKADEPAKRVRGCSLFQLFCEAKDEDADFSEYTVDWIRQLVGLFDDRAPEVVGGAWMALDALIKSIPKDEWDALVVPLRRTIESVGSPGTPVDGFSRPNGLKPILPVLLQGLLSGTSEQREAAAYAIGDLVERTKEEAFKAYCIQTVGPLIRVIGDRFPAVVKSAILSTLTIMLTRVPLFVKPFFPQLQRTFVKSLTDPGSLVVRNRGAVALGGLMKHQPRLDPLVTELTNLAVTEEGEVRDSVVNGLARAVEAGGQNAGEGAISAVVDVLSEAFAETNAESYNKPIAALAASLYLHQPDALESLMSAYVLNKDFPPTQLTSLVLRELLEKAPKVLFDNVDKMAFVDKVIISSAPSVAPSAARPARDARELAKTQEGWEGWEDGKAKLG